MGISYVRIQTQLLKICINFNCTNVNVIEPKSDSIQRCLEKYDAILCDYSFRTCYFTADSTMRRCDFMRMISSSFPSGGLTSSFQDHQFSQFIQIKRRIAKQIPTKKAVAVVGPQENHVWVLGANVHISSDGNHIESEFIWISDLYMGPGVADKASACKIHLPLNDQSLEPLLAQLKVIMKHNFFPALMLMGSSVMALHYNTIKAKFGFCPVPVAFGYPGTGKTTALKYCLSMMGLLPQRLWSSGTKQLFSQILSSARGYMPLGIDDPNSQVAISELVMSLYGGAHEGTLTRGTCKPTCMAIISANFTVKDSEKYLYIMFNQELALVAMHIIYVTVF